MKFKLFHVEQNHLFSHAGLTNEIWKQYKEFFSDTFSSKLEYVEHVLTKMSEEAFKAAYKGAAHQLFAAGWDRGGFARHGGINWVDWRNLSPISGVNQVVGHSMNRVPRIMIQKYGGGYTKKDIIEYYRKDNIVRELDKQRGIQPVQQKVLSTSYCLDTGGNHYMVIEDGDVQIYDLNTGVNLRDLDQYFIMESPMNSLS
jgi:hypothetical protein